MVNRGKLELSKCRFYILFCKFDLDGTSRMETATNMESEHACLTSGTSATRNPIKHRDNSEAHRTLGIWPTPEGNQTKQYHESLKKS
jgi:hypothetical protein